MKILDIIEHHELWLESDGQHGRRADFNGMNLSELCLSGRNLQGAVLSDLDLTGTNFTHVNLSRAYMKGSILLNAMLRYAVLEETDLREASMVGGYLMSANLTGADLTGADLRRATLTNTLLHNVNLRGARLTDEITVKTNNPPKTYSTEYFCIFIDDIIKIGCQTHYRDEWEKFAEDEIWKMDGERAWNFWQAEKETILSISEACN